MDEKLERIQFGKNLLIALDKHHPRSHGTYALSPAIYERAKNRNEYFTANASLQSLFAVLPDNKIVVPQRLRRILTNKPFNREFALA